MAAVNARPVGRRSHSVQFVVPLSRPPLPLDNALAELAREVRADWANLISGHMDTITQGAVTFEYKSNDQYHPYTIHMPAGQHALGARDGEGLRQSLQVLKKNVLDKLEDARLRGTDAQILGVREIRLQVNAGPRLLARRGYQG